MKRITILVTLSASMLASTAVFASLYGWNPEKRPPISISDALLRAEKLLGDDAPKRYCVSASLYGDETSDGKSGAWNLWYAASDGSRKHIYIDMLGKAQLILAKNPTNSEKQSSRRRDLRDVLNRLEAWFADENISPQISSESDTVVMTHHTRQFQVHTLDGNGRYSDQVQRMPGPEANGIWMKLKVINHTDAFPDHDASEPYWHSMRYTYRLADPSKLLSVDLRFGPKVEYDSIIRMIQVFGEQN